MGGQLVVYQPYASSNLVVSAQCDTGVWCQRLSMSVSNSEGVGSNPATPAITPFKERLGKHRNL